MSAASQAFYKRLQDGAFLQPDALPTDQTDDKGRPHFRFFPDAYASEVFKNVIRPCDCCRQSAYWTYDGPVYCRAMLDVLCPTCIATGRAAAEFGATFQHGMEYGEGPFDEALYAEVLQRTPGFVSWQGNQWLCHDGRPMVFRGDVDGQALKSPGRAAQRAAVKLAVEPLGLDDEAIDWLQPGGHISVYLFETMEGAVFKAYLDFD